MIFLVYFSLFKLARPADGGLRSAVLSAGHIAALNKFGILTLKGLGRMNDGVHNYLILPQDFKNVAIIHHALG